MTAKTPEYITVKELSEKWGVTKRRVNMCINDGRVPGAVRMGNIWLVPKDAEKPAGERGKKKAPEAPPFSDLPSVIEITSTPLPGGNPGEIPALAGEGWVRHYCEGALAYYRADYERVMQCCRRLGDSAAARLRYCPMAMAAAIGTGDYAFFLELEAWCKDLIKADIGTGVTVLAEYALACAYINAFAPDMAPPWFREGDLHVLPAPLRAEAICIQARHLLFLKRYESALDVARTALFFDKPELGISYSGFYLRTMCAAACCHLGRMAEAEGYLLEAMAICLPHGFISPFVVTAPLFDGLLERLLKREAPEHYKTVSEQAGRTVSNWLLFHNRFTKDNITTILSLREYEVASLVVQGFSYARVAERHSVSVSRIKSLMETIYAKLLISDRKELAAFIL